MRRLKEEMKAIGNKKFKQHLKNTIFTNTLFFHFDVHKVIIIKLLKTLLRLIILRTIKSNGMFKGI